MARAFIATRASGRTNSIDHNAKGVGFPLGFLIFSSASLSALVPEKFTNRKLTLLIPFLSCKDCCKYCRCTTGLVSQFGTLAFSIIVFSPEVTSNVD